MYAELAINIEAPLAGSFHYHVPRDLERSLATGHLVEVEFGRRLAQGIILQRIGIGSEADSQAALWDRVLRLRPSFFRGYSSGAAAH